MSTLDNFKKEAKRWLKALRSSDESARERLLRTYPSAPEDPALRHVQHALAREHGEENWLALKKALKVVAVDTREERVSRFLQFACWDHHTHGVSDHQMYAEAALRLLRQHPEIARDSIYTAVVCGEIEEVERILKARPELAREAGGARGWEPLLYLCYTRFPNKKSIDNAVRIARALLDRGANPNAFYMAGDSSYTALVGVAGEGEQDSPRQPQAASLFELLLERGAEPFDIQVLYNTHFHCHILWWLKLVYESTVKGGRKDAWDDPEWTMLDMGGYGPGAYFILSAAVEHNDLVLAEWALTHGASPNITRSGNPQFKVQHTLYERAQFQSLTEMADLLLRYGAERTEPQLDGEWAFVAASLRLAQEDVRASIEKHPEFLQSTRAMFEAARLDRDDVVALLLDLGVPINIENTRRERALHHAAGSNSLKVARLLLERGAEVDRREVHYNATPLGYAVHYWYEQMIALLSRYSRDVWNLAFTGNVDRMRELFREDPALARIVDDDGYTLLWWLPEDETRALEIVELLVEYGADPAARSNSGKTAADWATTRGMVEIAKRLNVDDGKHFPAAHERQVQVPALQVTDPPSREAPVIAPVQTYDLTPRMILPVEMRTALPVRLFDGVETTTTDVWSMLTASREGDLNRVRILLAGCPSLLHCDYNYMPPLHLAVREGHLELVRYLASLGAVNPHHRTYPYNETLLTVALDRGLSEIARIIEDHLNAKDSTRTDDENAKINYRLDGQRQTLENLVGANALAATEALIEEHPEVVHDELACWGEGILAVPSNRGNREMVELLVRHGARVPQVSKWGREYFFKHYDIALFFLENGTDPNHLNCHHTSLLHSMAQEGNLQKARLLLDHGADLDPIDEEFRSTPLGLAARWGHHEMVTFLLARGADPRKSGAPWAAPVEWARKKGHADIELELRRAGA